MSFTHTCELIYECLTCTDENIKWLDFYSDLVVSNGTSIDLKERYKHDGTHLNPVYVELLERSLNESLK